MPRRADCVTVWVEVPGQSFRVDALNVALTSAPVLRDWESGTRPDPRACSPTRRARCVRHPGTARRVESATTRAPAPPGAFNPAAFESRKLTQPERSYQLLLLELLVVVHALKTLRPCNDLLDKPL